MLYENALADLLSKACLSVDDEVLVVCGGRFDREVLSAAGFNNVIVSNLDTDKIDYVAPYRWDRQDAENLTYLDASFDVVIVHAGLHHCFSPHRALTEMLRVARRAVLVFEARDSFLLNVAKRLGFTMDYEIESVSGTPDMRSGGVAHTGVPNFIYRWTEREVLKTVRTAEPAYVPRVQFFYNLQLPYERFEKTSRPALKFALKLAAPVAEAVAKIFPKQSNEFGFLILKSEDLHPWLEKSGDEVVLSRAFVENSGRVYRKDAPDAPTWRSK